MSHFSTNTIFFQDVKSHEYFNGVDWNAIADKKAEFAPLTNVQAEVSISQDDSFDILSHSVDDDQLTNDDQEKLRGNVHYYSLWVVFI